MHKYKEMEVWKRSVRLAKDIYVVSNKLPKEEVYGLKSQIRRSAVSVPSNIAEGCGRNSNKQFVQFLQIAQGSLSELDTQEYLIETLIGIKINQEIKSEIISIQKILSTLQKKYKQ